MKTYNQYYKEAFTQHKKWLSEQKNKWWKNKETSSSLNIGVGIKGDYIETVSFLSEEEKNDSSIFENFTNVRNNEWDILFSMLGQALIDWCVENNAYDNLWSYSIHIDRTIDGLDNIFEYEHKLNNISGYEIYKETDENRLEKFNDCSGFLCDMIAEFISTHGKNIPNDWNVFDFELDDLIYSCSQKVWVPSSDGSITLGNLTNDTYESFVYSV